MAHALRLLSGSPMLRLHIEHDDKTVTMAFARLPVRIGRELSSDCRILLPFVSRLHATLDLRNGLLAVRDEGSRQGTWVADGHGGEARLEPGTFVDLAPLGGTFRIGEIRRVRIRAELVAALPTASSPSTQDLGGCDHVFGTLPLPDSALLASVRRLSTRYVPHLPAVNTGSAVALLQRLDQVLALLFEGLAAMRFAYRCETGGKPATADASRAELAATLLDWTSNAHGLDELRAELRHMLTHHHRLVSAVDAGLSHVLDSLDPAVIETAVGGGPRWSPWRYRALWREVVRRHDELRATGGAALGRTYATVATALRPAMPSSDTDPAGSLDAGSCKGALGP